MTYAEANLEKCHQIFGKRRKLLTKWYMLKVTWMKNLSEWGKGLR